MINPIIFLKCIKELPFSDCTYTDLHGWDFPCVNIGSRWRVISENEDSSFNLACGYSTIGVSKRVLDEHFVRNKKDEV